MDRASDYESAGRGFKSSWARLYQGIVKSDGVYIRVLRVIEWVNLYLLEHASKDFQTEIFLVS